MSGNKNGEIIYLNGCVERNRKSGKLTMDGGDKSLRPFAVDGEWGFVLDLTKLDPNIHKVKFSICY